MKLTPSLAAVALLALAAACSPPAPKPEETAPPPAAPAAAPVAEAPPAAPIALEIKDAAGASLTGDPAKGQHIFAQCRSCHAIEAGVNRVGPTLYGIVGRHSGSVEGFHYSDANKNSGVVWTEQELYAYLENPRVKIPGTTMSFAGLRDSQQRADVIAYLKSAAK